MYHVLLIQLHHPFITTGHLSSAAPLTARYSFTTCAIAADEIVRLLMAYNRTFSIRKAPYLISYATYVSATIHVRIAAQKPLGSEAHSCLQICLAVLNENQATNLVVSSARLTLSNLMKRTGVVCRDDQDLLEIGRMQELPMVSQYSSAGPQSATQALSDLQAEGYAEAERTIQTADPILIPPDFDIEMMLQSFGGEQIDGAHLNIEAGHGQYPLPVQSSSVDYQEAGNTPELEAMLLDPANTSYGPATGFNPQYLGVFDPTDTSRWNYTPDH